LEGAAANGTGESILGPDRTTARKRWAALIKQVYETDPLLCPKCGGEMKIISFTCLPAGRSSGIRARSSKRFSAIVDLRRRNRLDHRPSKWKSWKSAERDSRR
jgi:hypothetical protein